MLDWFKIINGLSGLDVFYGYCAAMVLILRLMRPAPSQNSDDGAPRQDERVVQASLRSLVANVQGVINRAEKGGSMRRFARVVDTFFNVIKKPPSARTPSAAAQGLPGHHQMQPGQHVPMTPQQMQYYQSQNFNNGPSGFSYDPNMAPEHQGMGPTPQFGQPYGDWFSVLPLSTFGNAGVTDFPFSNDNGDWADMEVILGRFGGYNG